MSRRTQKNVGIIGLGIIGSRVAEQLRRHGFHVFVWNRTPRPFPNFVGSRSEVADLCDFIQIFVSDDDALLETIEQIKPSLKAHHVVMAHCTVAPHTVRAAAEIVQRKGAQFLDAPFTGSKVAAEKGELVYYLGGDAATFQRARPVLEASSKEIIEIGEVGHATVIKVATNMITAATVQAAAEALALVDSAGVPAEKFAAAMNGNGSQSATLAMKLPNMISGNFEPHFSTKHMLKDIQIVSRLARSHGLNFGATEAARDSLRAEVEAGRGDFDYASMVRVFFPDGIEKPAGTEVEEGQQSLVLEETSILDKPDAPKLGSGTVDRQELPGDSLQSDAVVTAVDEKAFDAAADAPHVGRVSDVLTESDVPAKAPADIGDEAAEAETALEVPHEASHDSLPTLPEEPAPAPQAEAVGANNGGAVAASDDQSNGRRGFFSRMFRRGLDY